MATKLSRLGLLQFGSAVNGASEVGEFGSGATGSPVYTSSITQIQILGAWLRGWAAETIANNRPFLEDMNAVDCVFGYHLCYLLQAGIAEFDTSATTFYFFNSICQYSGALYQCINDNGGAGISATLPTATTYWKPLIPFAGATQNVVTSSRALNSVYHNTTGKTMMVTVSLGINTYAYAMTDGSSSPGTVVAEQELGAASYIVSITFLVLNGNYYEMACSSGTLQTWTEWY